MRIALFLLLTACSGVDSSLGDADPPDAASDRRAGDPSDAAKDGASNDAPQDSCAPLTCKQALGLLDAGCGTFDNGCSGMIVCGSCNAPDKCGGGADKYQCGCTPTPKQTVCANQQQGTCSQLPDGCYGNYICDSCSQTGCGFNGNMPHTCKNMNGWMCSC